jgi:2-keto-3-deoxy-L-rhamnonate aldolase RhmA
MADKSLKQRLREDEVLTLTKAPINASREQLETIAAQSAIDMFLVDAQHAPFNEDNLVSFCDSAAALEIPVHLRIKHTRHAFLIGNYLDLGPMAIMVPQVETEDTVDEAVDAFYYPPLGKRSYGPLWGYGFDDSRQRLEYAEWWNETGILVLQLESVNAVTNARLLAKPGVDMFAFGANDLNFSLEAYVGHPLKTVEDCIAHVEEQMAGTQVKVQGL